MEAVVVSRAAIVLICGVILWPTAALATGPELPRSYLDTTYFPPNGRTLAVPPGGDFQSALNAAQPGDVIALAPGATYRGPFTLPNKTGTGWITVRTAVSDHLLPPPGTRVTPSDTHLMPRLVASYGSVIMTAPGAHHYRFVGVEIAPTPSTFLYNLVMLGSPDGSQVPHHIVFDRSYVRGDPEKGSRRGIALNSGAAAVIDSHLADFKEVGADSQAVGGWNGPGPFKIVNNYIEGAGENIMFGGADPSMHDLVPADIEIRRNHLTKPLAWKIGDPNYAGIPWTVKNLLELKNARRVLIEGNLFERNWAHAQAGFAILLTVRNQKGTAPWSVVEDVTFRYNVVRASGSGVNILGRDTTWPSGSQVTKRIEIRHNLFSDIGGPQWGGGGRLFQLLQGTVDVVIEHNTALQTGPIIAAGGTPHEGFVFRGNIAPYNAHGVTGTGAGAGQPVLDRYFPQARFERNVLFGRPMERAKYHSHNWFPADLKDVGFRDPATGDYRLTPLSPYARRATGGGDIGADLDAISAVLSNPSWNK